MSENLLKNHLKIATRGSRLAIWQAEFVRNKILQFAPDFNVQIIPFITEGDKRLDQSLAEIGGKGLFIKELEKALIEGEADMAVHSIKDFPVNLPDHFSLAAVLERGDPRDVFVSNLSQEISSLPENSIVGTSSFRRCSLISSKYSNVKLLPLRGNLETRLKKLDMGDYDGIVLAAAGLKRLGMQSRIASYFEPSDFLPAVGQGAVGIEILKESKTLFKFLSSLEHQPSRWCVDAERAMIARLGGDCNFPIGGFAEIRGTEGFLKGFVSNPAGTVVLFHQSSKSSFNNPEYLGEIVAKGLIKKGALQLLANI